MISVWHLVWIVPLATLYGCIIMALIISGKD